MHPYDSFSTVRVTLPVAIKTFVFYFRRPTCLNVIVNEVSIWMLCSIDGTCHIFNHLNIKKFNMPKFSMSESPLPRSDGTWFPWSFVSQAGHVLAGLPVLLQQLLATIGPAGPIFSAAINTSTLHTGIILVIQMNRASIIILFMKDMSIEILNLLSYVHYEDEQSCGPKKTLFHLY